MKKTLKSFFIDNLDEISIRNKIKDLINSNKSQIVGRLIAQLPNLKNIMINFCKNLNLELDWNNNQLILWHYYHDKKINRCLECDKNTNFSSFKDGYHLFCSAKCSSNSLQTIKKRKETCLDKYEVDHPMKSDIVKINLKNSTYEKYGVYNVFQIPEIIIDIQEKNNRPENKERKKEKTIKTNLERYECENVFFS